LANSAVYFLISLPRKIGQYFYIKFLNDFDKEKIVYIEIMTDNILEGYDFPCFAFADAGVFILNTAYMMVGDTQKLKFILAVLNSLLGRFLTKIYTVQLGNRQFRMLHQYVQHFPIPDLSNEKSLECIKLVSTILDAKTDDTTKQSLFKELNTIIYSIYSLTDNEIAVINTI
jgi:adenine-specific DNA-methyltransferase